MYAAVVYYSFCGGLDAIMRGYSHAEYSSCVLEMLYTYLSAHAHTGSGDTASELLVSTGSGKSLQDFYPSIAINALMRIVKDQSLSQHHTMAIQALGFIFKSLGIKSVPYLPQVFSPFVCVFLYTTHMHSWLYSHK